MFYAVGSDGSIYVYDLIENTRGPVKVFKDSSKAQGVDSCCRVGDACIAIAYEHSVQVFILEEEWHDAVVDEEQYINKFC